MRAQHAHRYLHWREANGDARCVAIGGIRVDRAVSAELLALVSPYAVAATMEAAERGQQAAA